MKLKIFKFSMMVVATLGVFLTSCNDDDDNGGTPIDPVVEDELIGNVTEDVTLDPSIEYKLKGTYSIQAGAKLTIPAGTKIVADVETGEETSTYIVIQKGATIDIQGTAANPVLMTSANEEPGDWGGLIIAGNSTTTKGVDATAEVGGILYGGTNPEDNSGNIDYLIINYAGAAINAESEFNGLTLYAVGTGTTIDNVAALNGTDDGVEFFGGTVNMGNFYSENNEDDAIDWTEGWNGTLANSYVLHTAAGFSTVVEADGDNGNPSLDNLTAVSTVGGTALQFKKASGATITGLSLTGYEVSVELANPDQGDFAFIQIDGADADPANPYIAAPTVDIATFSWATSAQVGNQVLTGNITANTTLDPAVTYFLDQTLAVKSGATLTIPAGTKIIADVQSGEETNTYIVIEKGAGIDVQGTAEAPVVMTSANEEPGDWGGLILAGNSTTTKGVDAVAEVGGILYGGTDAADNSGNIDYLIINYAGAAINAESEFNGLTLYAVGTGTTIDNVAALNGTDDGVEFFGGTVDMGNFYSENNEDDAIDWTEGWNGTLTNSYVLHTAAGFSTVVEADGDNGNPSLDNLTAVSTVGGTALQFKKASGATITGLSLTGYDVSVELANPDQGDFAFIQIDGADADPANPYIAAPTVDIALFSWVAEAPEVTNEVLTGDLSTSRTLDANVNYFLDGTFAVKAGATLTIPAGTKIVADVQSGEETNTYIVVEKGASIDIQGTAEAPVVMTSANENPGDWGGLILAGNASTTKGVDAVAEVGGILYGGTVDSDNSGNIDYLVINYAGAAINSESEFNGLTLYAVGTGTTIDNVAALNGTDDGVEFFGGTVSMGSFYSENNEDDAIDWTEGWNGTLTNSYVLHTAPGFSTVVEADGDNGNPSLNNLTAISTVGGTALQFKKASGATITGLSLNGYATSVELANPDQGEFAFIQIEGEDADPALTYSSLPTVDVADFTWAGADADQQFSKSIVGEVTEDTTLSPVFTYQLEGTYSVEAGATLTIPAGTKIVADVESGEETSTYIVIQKGAMIDIQGTADNPVVMTSANEEPGDWGGLILAGNSLTTKGVDAVAEVGGILYGGTDAADNSGSIDYLIINYAGAAINAESEFNGLTLYAVGSGTTISNVAALNGTDDGVEFFGGTVSMSNYYSENNEDDAIDWTEGWNGTLTNSYVLHTAPGFSTVVEADGDNGNPSLVNLTAVSTVGGTALQFKKASGATITGLSLDGYVTSVELANPDQGEFSFIQIDGADADPAQSYNNAATVDVAIFNWVF